MSVMVLKVFALLILFSLEIFSGEKPAWITTKKHPRYPERLYILGVGAAKKTKNKIEDIQKANSDAFADIAKQIRVTVVSKSVVEQLEVITGKKAESVERASANLQVTSEITITGLKIVEVYFDDDDDIYYSLAVLERETAGADLRDKLKQYFNLYQKNLELGKKNIAEGNFYQALLNFSEAYKNAPLYNDLLPLYRFITRPLEEISGEWRLSDAILISDIKSFVQDVFSKLKVEKISGEEQDVLFNQPLNPLVLKVTYGDGAFPVSGFKFKFYFKNGRGKINETAVSDKSGIVKCEIYSLEPYQENFYTITATMDLSEFKIKSSLGYGEYDDWNDFLDRNEKVVTYTLRKKTLTLEDKLREAVLSLSSKVPDKTARIMVARIYYRDKLPGPISPYIKQKLEMAIETHTSFALVGEEEIKNVAVKIYQAGYSTAGVGTPESFANLSGAKVVIVGSYWDSADEVELNLKAIDAGSRIVLSTSNVKIPKNLLPNIPLAPENYNSKIDDEILQTESKGEELQVEVWVDRPDGVYYEGDEIKIFVRANRDCYINLVYYDAEGNAILVFPHKGNWEHKIEGNKIYKVPGDFVIKPPFGREILKVFASDKPFPIPKGKTEAGLIVLDSILDYMSNTRSIGLKAGRYAENSIALTTLPKNKQ
jgi:hypothetical protein